METQWGLGDTLFRVFVCVHCGWKKNPNGQEEIVQWEQLDRVVHPKTDIRKLVFKKRSS